MKMVMSVADLVQASGVAFGTSGARGLVSAMTDEVCHGYTSGFLYHLASQGIWKPGDRVALAGDLRASTPRILYACSRAVTDLGGVAEFCGFVPTPALAHYALNEHIAAVMVTGSHIPDDRNGIKFYRPDGEILKHEEASIMGQSLQGTTKNSDLRLGSVSSMTVNRDIIGPYIARYIDFFGSDYLAGMRIGVYQHSAVGRDVVSNIIGAMGAEVVDLGRSDQFISVDTEAVRDEDIALARRWSSEHRLDAIVSTDGDSDRPLVADEHGEWLRGDVLAMLCARELGMRTVATPVSSNTVVERCGYFERVHRTRIGSPYVVEAMQSAFAAGERLVCGYEANGGFLLGSDLIRGTASLSALPTRDAILPIITVLAAAVRRGSLGELVRSLPARFTFSGRVTEFSAQRRERLFGWVLNGDDRETELSRVFGPVAEGHLLGLDLTDGARMTFSNENVIHLRASGNAPELRCYTEAETPALANRLAVDALAMISDRF